MATPLERLARARQATLRFLEGLDDAALCAQPHPDFSPIGWHLGHVAFTEALWILDRGFGDRALTGPYAWRFAQDGRPKRERAEGLDRRALLAYMEAVRALVIDRWSEPAASDEPLRRDYLGWFLASHEHQHRETMATVLSLMDDGAQLDAPPLADDGPPPRVAIAGGAVWLGDPGELAYDNERPPFEVELAPFALDAHPVTATAWARFMEDGGYERRALWSDEGWAWRQQTGACRPRGWQRAGAGWSRPRLGKRRPVDGREPVWGVSWYEADAFARWRGGRLPSEAEFEHAAAQDAPARCVGLAGDGPCPVGGATLTDLLGNVWEWTADWFEPRPGFRAFPYRGYSVPYFGGTHRVLKGGSFATDPSLATPHFRNWYVPSTRTLCAGLRVAYDD